jgi:hypothetical protein
MAMTPSIDAAWAQIDFSDLDTSIPLFTRLMYALTHRFGQASATLAARAYVADRIAAGVRSPFTPRIAPLPVGEQVGKTVNWAVQPLTLPKPDPELAKSQVEGSVTRLVQNVGRQTIVDSVAADKKAKGWARVPEPGCCSFCALLATRGAVYKVQKQADFASHNNCRCHAEPVFNAYEPSAQVREWQALYRSSTAGVHGMSNLQNAFRRAFDAPAS